MSNSVKALSDEEFILMLRLLHRYASTEMDQFDLWRFDTSSSRVFVEISWRPAPGADASAYTDLSHLIDDSQSN